MNFLKPTTIDLASNSVLRKDISKDCLEKCKKELEIQNQMLIRQIEQK